MTLSIVIPTYNTASFLRDAVDSVINQSSFKPENEIIVVDDGSTDSTSDVMYQYTQTFSFIRYIKTEHHGASHARNVGIKDSAHPFIAFLDADDIWLDGKLAAQELEFKKDPTLQLCTCLGSTFLDHRSSMEGLKVIPPESLEPVTTTPLPSGWLLKQEVIGICGMFEESLSIAHDFDLFLRFRQKDINWKILPETLFKRRIHQHNISHDFKRNRTEIFKALRSAYV